MVTPVGVLCRSIGQFRKHRVIDENQQVKPHMTKVMCLLLPQMDRSLFAVALECRRGACRSLRDGLEKLSAYAASTWFSLTR